MTNEHDALLVPKNNADALREALRRVIADKELARRLVENGTRTYQAKFTKEAFVRASSTLYQRVVESAGA